MPPGVGPQRKLFRCAWPPPQPYSPPPRARRELRDAPALPLVGRHARERSLPVTQERDARADVAQGKLTWIAALPPHAESAVTVTAPPEPASRIRRSQRPSPPASVPPESGARTWNEASV